VNLRKITCSAILLLALGLASCGPVRRASKDLVFALGTPVMMLYGGGTDAAASAEEVRAGLDGGAATEVIALIPAFIIHAIKHGLYGVVHAVDFFLFPIYGLAELHPYGPEIEPLDYYTGTWFDKADDGATATDAESGEAVTGR
jgi:hypothetical protein